MAATKSVAPAPPPKPLPLAQKKPPSSASAPSPAPELSTSKVWVVPPRPKPGRKPSADTPSSARKAQNRAAQRAFRERRAARVGELEERIAEIEKERDARERKLYAALEAVSKDNTTLRKALAELQAQSPNNTTMIPQGNPKTVSGAAGATPAPSPVASTPGDVPMEALDRALEERLPVPPPNSNSNADSSLPNNRPVDSCVVCVKDDCICASIGLNVRNTPSAKSVPLNRKPKSEGASTPIKQEMEIDFTAQFAKPQKKMAPIPKSKPQPAPAPSTASFRPSTPQERCGFCSDGTPCMCAEVAEEQSHKRKRSIDDIGESMTLAPIVSHGSPVNTPLKLPALQPDFDKEVVTVPSTAPPPSTAVPSSGSTLGQTPNGAAASPSVGGGCSGNPGNCAQCRSDPMSTLFCTTLAERQTQPPEETPVEEEAYIPCAAAYQTLSRHKVFKQVDLGRLVGRLHTRGMQVEVSSVANVLRELDRRLYD
uniref:ARAD1C12540p n=1 Tax=Blastobotrys adeninivorans TaxID=409370 RepID=A0A060T105_BLAAD